MSIPASVERLPISNMGSQSANRGRNTDEVPTSTRNIDADAGIGGTVLDFGRPGGAGLSRESRGWEWSWAKREDRRLMLEHGKPDLLVPPTRLRYPSLSSQTLLSTVTQSANRVIRSAVDKYEHLGLDELILPHLEEVHAQLRDPTVDHFSGNVLEVIHNPRAKYVKTMLVFAIGEVGQDLNISPFLPKSFASKSSVNLEELALSPDPVATYSTSILQICVSGAQQSGRMDRDATCLLVRLHSTVHWLHVHPNQEYAKVDDASCASVIEVGQVPALNDEGRMIADTEGRRIMDMALDPNSWGRAVLVDEGGGVWLWVEEKQEVKERQQKVLRLIKIRDALSNDRDGFWKIAFGPKDDTVIVIGEREAVLIDLQDLKRPPIDLLSLTGEGRFFTSLDQSMAARKAGYMVFCTTHEVVWVDEQNPGSPVLSWKHHYGGGKQRDLQLSSIVESGVHRILLSSPSNPLVMVFTVSDRLPLESLCRPYHIPLPSGLQGLHSTASLGLLRNAKPSSTWWMTMGEDGSIYGMPLNPSRDPAGTAKDERASRPGRIESTWSRSSVALDRLLGATRMDRADNDMDEDEEGRVMPERGWKEMNARWAWLEINDQPADEDNKLYADDFERYLREYESPMSHWMTGAELLREAATSEESEPKPKYASANIDTAEPTAWDAVRFEKHFHQIAAFPFDSTAGESSFAAILNQLQASFPAPTGLSATVRTRHGDHLHRLAIDLAWSSHILSTDPAPPLNPATSQIRSTGQGQSAADEFLSRAANLTLSEREPPPLAFSVLSPRDPIEPPVSPSGSPTDEAIGTNASSELQSLPARALISEWTLGGDPAEYIWKSWRAPSSPSTTPLRTTIARPIKPLPSPRHSHPPVFASQQIPAMYSATQPAPLRLGRAPPVLGGAMSMVPFMRERARSGSPAAGAEDEGIGMPMTQIEPGPYGGRGAEKKKKGKKRAGGF